MAQQVTPLVLWGEPQWRGTLLSHSLSKRSSDLFWWTWFLTLWSSGFKADKLPQKWRDRVPYDLAKCRGRRHQTVEPESYENRGGWGYFPAPVIVQCVTLAVGGHLFPRWLHTPRKPQRLQTSPSEYDVLHIHSLILLCDIELKICPKGNNSPHPAKIDLQLHVKWGRLEWDPWVISAGYVDIPHNVWKLKMTPTKDGLLVISV